jgi:LysM repeat protein
MVNPCLFEYATFAAVEMHSFAPGFFEGKTRGKNHTQNASTIIKKLSTTITMNNSSPLLPQGSLLEQKNQGRARVKIAVFVVLAIHGIGLLALLMQGCKKEPEPTPGAEQGTNVSTNIEPPALPAAETNVQPTAVTNPAPQGVTQPEQPPVTEYAIVQGDTLSTIAKKFHVSLPALMAANPGIEPTKLQIGQKLHIPPPAPTTTTSSGGTTAPVAEIGPGEAVYTVKSGDTLTSIATQNKVTVKALRSANNLTTDRIRVGQKLKIPAKADTGTNTTTPTTTPPAK